MLDPSDVGAMVQHAGPYSSMTSVANVTGQPAISLPLARFADGLPLGLQLSAASGRDDLLRVASQLETAQPWPAAPAWPPPDREPTDLEDPHA